MERGKVLIVDDDPEVRRVLSHVLGTVGGYQTDTAFDGIDGINKVRDNEYDIVFTDLTMPRLSGMDVLKETRRLDSSLSVVVITGFSSIDNAINAMKEGARDFITKPFNFDKIIILTEKIIGERRLFGKISPSENLEGTLKRLSGELYRSLYEMGIFQKISSELEKFSHNREIYEKIVDMAARLLMVKEASFGLVENGELKIEEGIGIPKKRIPVSGTIFSHVIRNKTFCMAPCGEINPHDGTCLASELFAIPFIINDEVFGILSLSNKADGTAFTDYEISLATSFARKAAMRIENNALYEVFYSNLMSTLRSLVISIEARDMYTKDHSERVTAYALQIAEVMDLSLEEKGAIELGGYLHDIGKIGIRDTVLLKPGRLSDEEMTEIMQHPVIGDNIMKPIRFFPLERELVRHHHEKVNGRGYPDGLAGDDIPLIARILAVADTFDAMTSSRPYRKAQSHTVAVEELIRCSNSQFDGRVVRSFLKTQAGMGAALGT